VKESLGLVRKSAARCVKGTFPFTLVGHYGKECREVCGRGRSLITFVGHFERERERCRNLEEIESDAWYGRVMNFVEMTKRRNNKVKKG